MRKGEVLFRAGDAGDELFLIFSGSVVVSKPVTGRVEQVLNRLGQGEVFGEMSVFGDEQKRSATIQAEIGLGAARAAPGQPPPLHRVQPEGCRQVLPRDGAVHLQAAPRYLGPGGGGDALGPRGHRARRGAPVDRRRRERAGSGSRQAQADADRAARPHRDRRRLRDAGGAERLGVPREPAPAHPRHGLRAGAPADEHPGHDRLRPQEPPHRGLPHAHGAGDVPLGADGRARLAAGDRHGVRPALRRLRLRDHPGADQQAPARGAAHHAPGLAPARGPREESAEPGGAGGGGGPACAGEAHRREPPVARGVRAHVPVRGIPALLARGRPCPHRARGARPREAPSSCGATAAR